MATHPADGKARLIALLTERPEYAEAYRNDPEFHAVVQSIATIMPNLLKVAFDASKDSAQAKRLLTQEVERGFHTHPVRGTADQATTRILGAARGL